MLNDLIEELIRQTGITENNLWYIFDMADEDLGEIEYLDENGCININLTPELFEDEKFWMNMRDTMNFDKNNVKTYSSELSILDDDHYMIRMIDDYSDTTLNVIFDLVEFKDKLMMHNVYFSLTELKNENYELFEIKIDEHFNYLKIVLQLKKIR